MSIHQLASLLNEAQERGDLLVRETWDKVILSRLSPNITHSIAALATSASLNIAIMDGASRDIALGDVDDVQAPYQIVLDKPGDTTTGYLLTLPGMNTLLFDMGSRRTIHVGGLRQHFESLDFAFVPWGSIAADFAEPATLKSPREFVREYGDKRIVPQSIGPWLMLSPSWHADEPVFVRWASIATSQCVLSLCDEIRLYPPALVFNGPPRGSMAIPDIAKVDEQLFAAIQACATWVYETASETEMRHPLLTAEIARFAPADTTVELVAAVFKTALEGARLAYQLGMSKLSSDTLKMLTDLRKSVLDEAIKVSDGTRQLVAAVATTLSLGIGMIAVKIGAHADGRIIGAISVIAVTYLVAIVWSGYRFLSLQDEIRDQWKPRTYGFISAESYTALVEEPAKKAANAYRTVARIGCWLVFAMSVVIVWAVKTFP